MMMNETGGGMDVYGGGTGIGYGVAAPMSGTTTAEETLPPPMYGSIPVKADSGLSYGVPVAAATRKRSREDDINALLSFAALQNQNQNQNQNRNHSSSSAAALAASGSLTFLNEDTMFQIQQQQLETENFITQHMENMRKDLDERRRRYSRMLMELVEMRMNKRLKAKEEEIQKIGKLNWALEERVKSLSMENQIWRDLAQTSQATANALRSNLEQVLAQVHHHDEEEQNHQNCHQPAAVELADDAQSCCGSNYNDEEEEEAAVNVKCNGNGSSSSSSNSSRVCRKCGREEACVLLLPCRHLCLCSVCGSSLNTCPVCKSTKTASFHVNMSF